MIDVSIIIPVYNREKNIRHSLQSVLAQTFNNYEILVIDDGSTQPIGGLQEIDPRICVLRHDENKGAPAARNTGILHARGEFIAFLDSDDTWLPEKLSLQISFLEKNLDIDICTTGYIYKTEEGTSVEIPKNQNNWGRFIAKGIGLAPGSTMMVHKNIIEQYLFDTLFPRLEDWDWFIRLMQNHSLYVIQEPLAIIHRGTHPSAEFVEKANLLILNKHADYFRNLSSFYGKQCMAKRYLEIATHYFREKKQVQGWSYLWKTIKTNPIQRPSMYLRILDYLLGTNVLIFIKNLRNRFQKKS